MSRLDRPHRNVEALAEAITENDGDELRKLLLDDSESLVSAIIGARDYFDRNYAIDKLIYQLVTDRAAQLWAEQPHIYVASASELREMEALCAL